MAYDPSEVLVLYLGAGESGGYSPMGHEERLRAAFPIDFTSARESIEKYLQFPDYPPTEWAYTAYPLGGRVDLPDFVNEIVSVQQNSADVAYRRFEDTLTIHCHGSIDQAIDG